MENTSFSPDAALQPIMTFISGYLILAGCLFPVIKAMEKDRMPTGPYTSAGSAAPGRRGEVG